MKPYERDFVVSSLLLVVFCAGVFIGLQGGTESSDSWWNLYLSVGWTLGLYACVQFGLYIVFIIFAAEGYEKNRKREEKQQKDQKEETK
jgi:hypothetical protein